jgi:hypothetical protein
VDEQSTFGSGFAGDAAKCSNLRAVAGEKSIALIRGAQAAVESVIVLPVLRARDGRKLDGLPEELVQVVEVLVLS